MSDYETYIDELEDTDTGLSPQCVGASADALSFVEALHAMFKENGVDLPETPDVSDLEHIIDGIMGELAAASLFLSEPSFKSVPSMLRAISSSFPNTKEEEVPTVVLKGFSRLADRIEATRWQTEQMKEIATN